MLGILLLSCVCGADSQFIQAASNGDLFNVKKRFEAPSPGLIGSALEAAAIANELDVVRWFLENKGSLISQDSLEHGFQQAAKNGNTAVVWEYLSYKGENRPGDLSVDTALMYAIDKNHPEVVEKISQDPRSFKINKRDFFIGVAEGKDQIVEILKRHDRE